MAASSKLSASSQKKLTKSSLRDPSYEEMCKLETFGNKVFCGDSLDVLRKLPSDSVALSVTSPPYWNLVDYGVEGQYGQGTYPEYLEEMLEVLAETQRVLRPNGKVAVVVPIVPLSKKADSSTHTRKLVNIAADIEHAVKISSKTADLHLFSMYIWQKQTSKKMFGSYPFPPNIYEDNTIEFINVYVKNGAPPKFHKEVKEASKMDQQEWLNLTMQVWPIMPSDIQRKGLHPAPFPIEIPKRLIAMYTFRALPKRGYAGDVVLDMFMGSGTTCVAAAEMGRQYIGIDINQKYCESARERLKDAVPRMEHNLIIDKVRMPKKGPPPPASSTMQSLFDDIAYGA